MLFILLDSRYNNNKYFPHSYFLKSHDTSVTSWIAKMKTGQQLSESHHSKSNTSYSINFMSLEILTLLQVIQFWIIRSYERLYLKKKRKTLSEKRYYSISVIHCLQDNLITGKLHDICFLPPSHYIKLLKLPWLSHSNFILQFPPYKIGILILLYFRWALWDKMRTSKVVILY